MLSITLFFLWIIQCVNYFIIMPLLPYTLDFKKAILCVQYLSTHEGLLRFVGITLKILPQMQRILSFFLQKASHIFTYDEIFIECNVNSNHIAVLPRWHKHWQKLLCQLPTLHTLVAPFLLLKSINCHYHPINAQTVIFFSASHISQKIKEEGYTGVCKTRTNPAVKTCSMPENTLESSVGILLYGTKD